VPRNVQKKEYKGEEKQEQQQQKRSVVIKCAQLPKTPTSLQVQDQVSSVAVDVATSASTSPPHRATCWQRAHTHRHSKSSHTLTNTHTHTHTYAAAALPQHHLLFFFAHIFLRFFKSVVCRKSIKKRVSLTQSSTRVAKLLAGREKQRRRRRRRHCCN